MNHFRNLFKDLRDREGDTDLSCGTDQHLSLRDAKEPRGLSNHLPRILEPPPAGAGIGVTTIDNHGRAEAGSDMPSGDLNRRRLDLIGGKTADHLSRDLGVDQCQIKRLSLLNTGGDTCKFKTRHPE